MLRSLLVQDKPNFDDTLASSKQNSKIFHAFIETDVQQRVRHTKKTERQYEARYENILLTDLLSILAKEYFTPRT